MGTIVIEEYSHAGNNEVRELPVYNLGTLLARTSATSSTSDATLALNSATTLVRVYTAEIHRLATAATGSLYHTTEAAKWYDLGVPKGGTLYYRTDV